MYLDLQARFLIIFRLFFEGGIYNVQLEDEAQGAPRSFRKQRTPRALERGKRRYGQAVSAAAAGKENSVKRRNST